MVEGNGNYRRPVAGRRGTSSQNGIVLSVLLNDVSSCSSYDQVSEKKNYNLQTFKKDERVFSFKKDGKLDQFVAVFYPASSKVFFGQVKKINEDDEDTGVVQFYKSQKGDTSGSWFCQDDKDLNTVKPAFVYAWDISVEISVNETKSGGLIIKIVNDLDIFEKTKNDIKAWVKAGNSRSK